MLDLEKGHERHAEPSDFLKQWYFVQNQLEQIFHLISLVFKPLESENICRNKQAMKKRAH